MAREVSMDRAESMKREINNRGKFLSLNRLEAKRLLEVYVKRSLSTSDKKTKEYKWSETRKRKIRRPKSSLKKFTGSKAYENIKANKKSERDNHEEHKPDNHNLDNEKLTSNISESSTNIPLTTGIDNAKVEQTEQRPSWFKKFLGLWYKENNNEEIHVKYVQGKVCMDNVLTEKTEAFSNDGLHQYTSKKRSLRRNSIRIAFSFKKNENEGAKGDVKEVDSGGNRMPRRPSMLPLKHVSKPLPRKSSKNNKNCYYNKVSAEIEQIVKENNDPEANSDKTSLDGEFNSEDSDALITKIAFILQKQGDRWNKKIKEDPTITSFFREISYNSFKQLADVYVEKEFKKKVTDVASEDIKLAYSIHFTAQVAGISSHPVNRIMGFGNRYLEDTFTHFSYNNKVWTSEETLSEGCMSPD